MYRYVAMTDGLHSLDVSGNISIGNEGALQLLQACISRRGLCLEEGSQTSLNLRACGIESPLSNQFVQVVQRLHQMGEKPRSLFKVVLLGNLIDIGDMSRLTCTVLIAS